MYGYFSIIVFRLFLQKENSFLTSYLVPRWTYSVQGTALIDENLLLQVIFSSKVKFHVANNLKGENLRHDHLCFKTK